MRVIGITGGIGCGKSAVLAYLRETYGDVVCGTDETAHRLQMPGTDCYRKIVEHFGTSVLNEDKTIDRKALGALVFADAGELAFLNSVVHPAVKKEVKRRLREAYLAGEELFFIESALLMEDHYEEICDELWYIYADEAVRRKRLKASRALSDEKISAVMRAQADEETFRNYCHIVIDNSASFEQTRQQIIQAVSRR